MTDVSNASDILATYTRDVARYKVLSREEEAEIGYRARAGDREAQEMLIRANLRFVIVVAKRYQHHGVPLMDLIQAGNIGLAHAAEKFDPAMGNRFISYAISWIKQAITREINANKAAIMPTPTQMGRVSRIRRLQEEARQKLGRELTVAELVRKTGYTEARVLEALEYRPKVQSLDTPVNPTDGTTTTLAQVLGYDDGREEREEEAALEQATRRVMAEVLTPREREILEEYYGFGNRRERSLAEIAVSQGVTRERIRQIKERALRKLRAAREHHPLLLEHFCPAKLSSKAKRFSISQAHDEEVHLVMAEAGQGLGQERHVQGDFWDNAEE